MTPIPKKTQYFRQSNIQGSAEIIAVLGLVAVIGITVGMSLVSFQTKYKRAISSLNQSQSFYATETAGRAKLFQTLGVPPTITTAMQMGPSLWEKAYFTPPSDFIQRAGFNLFPASALSAFLPSDAWGSDTKSNAAGSREKSTVQVLHQTDGSGGAPSSENILSYSTKIAGSGKAPSAYVRTLASGTKEYCGTQQFSSSEKTYQTCVLFTSTGPAGCVESTDSEVKTFSNIWGGTGDNLIIEMMNASIRDNNLPYTQFSLAYNYANPWMFLRSTNGVEDLETLKEVCNELGYRDYVSSTCDSGHTGCNFASPGDNSLFQYTAANKKWNVVPASGAKTYLYTVTCQGKKVCYDAPPPPTTGNWYQATGQDCSTFCSGRGMQNVQSPDSWTITDSNGQPFLMAGSACTSGEVIPQSASAAKLAGTLNYPYGCWPNCTTGAVITLGKGVGTRCYGRTGWNGSNSPQTQDNDATDTTVGCYCKP